MTVLQRLQDAIEKSNDMVIAASLMVMDRNSTPAEIAGGKFSMSLFTAIRDVCTYGAVLVGPIPECIVALADSILDGEQ